MSTPDSTGRENTAGQLGGIQPLACWECGIESPPPTQTCHAGMDHFVGRDRGCPHCGRTVAACALRPCPEFR
jgi:hypothetical protein